jgi:periplasmic protein CpxP/Spy
MSTRSMFGVVVVSLAVSASSLAAQPGRTGVAGDRPKVQQQRQQQQPGQRAIMERRVEARINQIIRTQLALNDEQFKQLRDVSARVEVQRRALRRDEMATRSELRRQLLDSQPANEARIAELLDQLPKLERRRIDVLEQQQRELARFLSPSQRARYFALEDDLRRNLQESQRRRLDGPPLQGPPDRPGSPRGGGRPPVRPPAP